MMATSIPADPEIAAFVYKLEQDDRIRSIYAYKHHPSTPETYLINIQLPANTEVTFTSHSLLEAKRYIRESIDGWWRKARTLDGVNGLVEDEPLTNNSDANKPHNPTVKE